ncbi:MAG: hypothetical protein M1821_009236 [Bathelium mastoideum]|nr:MAG: hypothetical protein M1821_009236 [Bathelium mastoideum]KAI9682819.1 MAG: hypothetical protein M1822_006309 [Bathelium mastoideum]
MLSFMRQQVPRTNTASQNPLTYEDGRSKLEFHTPSDPYILTNTLPPGETFFTPPLHLHLFQTEIFRVESGTAAFYLRPTSKDPGRRLVAEGGTIEIPKRAYHTFENASTTENLVLSLRFDPQRWEAEESFFRNFSGYLEDCRKAKKSPSPIQVMRMLHENDTPVAVPVPSWCPEWVGTWVSRAFQVVIAVVIGEYLLGYKGSYPEYYRKRTQ